MNQPVWRFVRGDERLEISREPIDDGMALIVAGDGAPRSYFFRDLARLEVFQRDMETLLLKTGWTFQAFAPDRRAGSDRRGWPRRSNDRRRWWTDGQAKAPRTKDANASGQAIQGDGSKVSEPQAEPDHRVGTPVK